MKITFAEKEIELKSLTLNDWVSLEEMGIDIAKFGKGVQPTFKDMRALIFIALHKADKTFTLELVGDNIDPIKDISIFNEIVNFIMAKDSQATETT